MDQRAFQNVLELMQRFNTKNKRKTKYHAKRPNAIGSSLNLKHMSTMYASILIQIENISLHTSIDI